MRLKCESQLSNRERIQSRSSLTLHSFLPLRCSNRLPFGIVPGGETATMLVKKIAALNCILFVGVIQLLFGYWKPGKDPLGSHLKRK